jgi:hypothetical protein
MTYRYPWRAMAADHVRAVVGVTCTATPLIFLEPPGLVQGVLAFLAVIFSLFGLQAVLRHTSRVLVSERDICALPLGKRLAWDGLTRLTLGYFSVRRDGRRGWMELKVQSGRRALRIDSRLDGFTEVVRLAAAAASGACLELDASTLSNLAILGIDMDTGMDAGSGMKEHG